MRVIRVLILEDDLRTLSIIMNKLFELEEETFYQNDKKDFAITLFSEYHQVKDYLNKSDMVFDVILLDRDCKAGGSFHILDFKKFDSNKIIAISTVPEYNDNAVKNGVKTVVRKNFAKMDEFGEKLTKELKNLI